MRAAVDVALVNTGAKYLPIITIVGVPCHNYRRINLQNPFQSVRPVPISLFQIIIVE